MSNEDTPSRLELLVVEDNPGDVHLIKHALRMVGAQHNVSSVADGAAALAFVRRQGEHAHAPRPDVILLDLNLPKRGGREVLRELKKDPELQEIPVLVLTSSEAQQDIRESYALKANCYITKPVELQDFLAVVHAIDEFWCRTVRLPGREPSLFTRP
jgi:two-component system, chemotaxis family, response regulator Rcp1